MGKWSLYKEFFSPKDYRSGHPYLKEAGLIDDKFAEERYSWLELLVKTVQESLDTVAQIPEKVDFIFKENIDIVEEDALEVLKENKYLQY